MITLLKLIFFSFFFERQINFIFSTGNWKIFHLLPNRWQTWWNIELFDVVDTYIYIYIYASFFFISIIFFDRQHIKLLTWCYNSMGIGSKFERRSISEIMPNFSLTSYVCCCLFFFHFFLLLKKYLSDWSFVENYIYNLCDDCKLFVDVLSLMKRWKSTRKQKWDWVIDLRYQCIYTNINRNVHRQDRSLDCWSKKLKKKIVRTSSKGGSHNKIFTFWDIHPCGYSLCQNLWWFLWMQTFILYFSHFVGSNELET